MSRYHPQWTSKSPIGPATSKSWWRSPTHWELLIAHWGLRNAKADRLRQSTSCARKYQTTTSCSAPSTGGGGAALFSAMKVHRAFLDCNNGLILAQKRLRPALRGRLYYGQLHMRRVPIEIRRNHRQPARTTRNGTKTQPGSRRRGIATRAERVSAVCPAKFPRGCSSHETCIVIIVIVVIIDSRRQFIRVVSPREAPR